MRYPIIAFAIATAAASPTIAQPLSAESNARASLERIARIDAQLHSVIAIDPTAMDQARAFDSTRRSIGMVAGQPVLIKDNIEAAGPFPATARSLALANNGTHPQAPLVPALRSAGTIILAEKHTTHTANMP